MMRFLAVAVLLPTLLACGDDTAGPGDDTAHVGVYQLQTVNGEEVPISFEEDGGVFTVVGATLALNANETFTFEADFEFTVDGETTSETETFSGSYTKVGNNVTFTHGQEDGGFETATISGDVLTTQGGDGEVLVFEK